MNMFTDRINQCIITVPVLLVLLVSFADADDYHYVNMLVGSRAIGLGGAYTAIADDPAGCYYNPAGITFAPNNGLSASVNAFYQSTKTYESAMTRTDGSKVDWEQESFSILPNFFGVVRKMGNGALGFSYVVADDVKRRQKQNFFNIQSNLSGNAVQQFTININDSDRRYFFGPSYAYQLSGSLSIGASLYVYYRDKELIRNQFLQFQQGEHYLLNYYETGTDWGYKPMLGVIWEPLDKISVGMTISRIFVSSSDNETQLITRDTTQTSPQTIGGNTYDYSNTDTIYFGNTENSTKEDFPLTLSFGIAYFASPRLLFSGDITYYEAIAEKEQVVNLSFGTEYYLSEAFAIRAGFYTDIGNTPPLASGYINQSENIDLYSASLSVTMYQGAAGITLGCLYGFGNGDAQIIANSTSIQDISVNNLALYISANYSY